jgi:hypothetical protein
MVLGRGGNHHLIIPGKDSRRIAVPVASQPSQKLCYQPFIRSGDATISAVQGDRGKIT